MELDARGLECPEPTFKARLQLRKMNDGEPLTVITNNERCAFDLQRMCLMLDHTLLSVDRKGVDIYVNIIKGL